jgi:DNA modification methylase
MTTVDSARGAQREVAGEIGEMLPNPVIIGAARLYCGDARAIMPGLSPVDCIVSDLPYPLESGGNKTGEMKGKFARGRYDNSGAIIPCDIEFDEIMPLAARCLPSGHAYFMVNNRHVAGVQNAALAAGFRFHNWLVWDKRTGTPNRWYMKNCEFTLLVFRGAAVPINDCGARQLIRCPNVINGLNDTQKPVPLMEHYIRNSTGTGDLVLDPFMGSGTTGVAAINLGRRFIGIERDPKQFKIACERIAQAQGGWF